MASCATGHQLPVETHRKDSTVVNYLDSTVVSIRDSLILVPIPVESSSAVLPDGFRSHVETSIAESDAWLEDGLLHHTIRNRSESTLPALVPITTTAQVIRSDNDHTGLLERTIVKEVEKKLTWWQRFRLGAFFWLLGLALIGWRREILWLLRKII
ncbi:MAG: hypothetical protein K6G86_07845 [Bacteroidales bacterium]|nr:hypothetical protein [Bacteroidales bacterium]